MIEIIRKHMNNDEKHLYNHELYAFLRFFQISFKVFFLLEMVENHHEYTKKQNKTLKHLQQTIKVHI